MSLKRTTPPLFLVLNTKFDECARLVPGRRNDVVLCNFDEFCPEWLNCAKTSISANE
jgi:hypothetical protein